MSNTEQHHPSRHGRNSNTRYSGAGRSDKWDRWAVKQGTTKVVRRSQP